MINFFWRKLLKRQIAQTFTNYTVLYRSVKYHAVSSCTVLYSIKAILCLDSVKDSNENNDRINEICNVGRGYS